MKPYNLLFIAFFFLFAVIYICCSSNNDNSADVIGSDMGNFEDVSNGDIDITDTSSDSGLKDKYFAISFDERKLAFFDRKNLSDEPFLIINAGGEISTVEIIRENNIIVYSDLKAKELILLKDFKEIKRISNIGDYPYSMTYIPRIKLLIIPDKSSNRLYIYDMDKMEFSSLSPMTAGGNSPISLCFDDSPLTQGLQVRLLILNYGSLNVRAYDIFDKENWALRPEKLPTLSEPLKIACDSVNRRLLVVNSASNNISAFELNDLVQIANSPFEAGKNPTFAAMHSGASIAYVTNTNDDSLTIFSTKEMKAKGGISFKPQDRPSRVYVNESENRLYVLLSGAKALLIYDIEDPLLPVKLGQINFDSTPREVIYR